MSQFFRWVLYGGMLFCLCVSINSAFAFAQKKQSKDKTILVIAKNFQGNASNLAKSLSLSSLGEKHDIINISLDDWLSNKPKADLIISIGNEPLENLLSEKITIPLLSVLITSKQWHSIRKHNATDLNVNAIFYDPDLIRQALLAKMLLPKAKSIGLMYSETNDTISDLLKIKLKQLNLELNTLLINNNSDVIRKYPALSDQSDIIIAIPDTVAYTNQTLPRILLTSYRQQKPVIGYSTGMVKAGAVATTFTSFDMLIKDTEETALDILNAKVKNDARHSKYYSIKYNDAVSLSLGLKPISQNLFEKELQRLLSQ